MAWFVTIIITDIVFEVALEKEVDKTRRPYHHQRWEDDAVEQALGQGDDGVHQLLATISLFLDSLYGRGFGGSSMGGNSTSNGFRRCVPVLPRSPSASLPGDRLR